MTPDPYFDRYDICEAAWVFAGDYNVSGFTALPTDRRDRDIFGRLSRLKFKPRPDLSYETLEPNGQEWYDLWALLEGGERG